MKKWTLLLTTLACTGAFTLDAADRDRERQTERRESRQAADIDTRVRAINRLDNNQQTFRAGLTAVSKETAVPLPTIEAEHKDNPRVGLAGLFMAHEISVKTKKPVDQLLRQASSGRSWSEIARANNLDLSDVEQKLDRIESAMRGQTATGKNERTPVRAEESARTDLDRKVAAVNDMDDQPLQMRTGLAAISKQTATPLPRVEELQKQHPNASVGDLFVAQELATKTQKSANEFLRQHADGKSWSKIIADQNQVRTDIEQKLERIEQAMKEAK